MYKLQLKDTSKCVLRKNHKDQTCNQIVYFVNKILRWFHRGGLASLIEARFCPPHAASLGRFGLPLRAVQPRLDGVRGTKTSKRQSSLTFEVARYNLLRTALNLMAFHFNRLHLTQFDTIVYKLKTL